VPGATIQIKLVIAANQFGAKPHLTLVAIGDRATQASALQQLGDLFLAAGRRPDAAARWRQALTILEDLGDPAAADLRTRLSGR